ncbi:MAG: spore germination protein, partial [Paenibacillaceae bacterium]|nr:spore germination protein [Paenibacillaceae bacterium]
SAVSIVGALVIGQAAIQARIASPIMVIVVALTGIASFAIPHYEMGIALRVLRFPLMIVVGALGFFGLMAGFLVIFLHLCSMYSLGEPYLQSLAPLRVKDLRDVFIRAPIKQMLRKPRNPRLLGNPRRDNR